MQQTTLNVSLSLSVSRYHAGLRIISNLDEVAFIQNLVFYIEAAYKVAVSNIFRGLGGWFLETEVVLSLLASSDVTRGSVQV